MKKQLFIFTVSLFFFCTSHGQYKFDSRSAGKGGVYENADWTISKTFEANNKSDEMYQMNLYKEKKFEGDKVSLYLNSYKYDTSHWLKVTVDDLGTYISSVKVERVGEIDQSKKRPTYILKPYLTYDSKWEGSLCEARASIVVNGKKMGVFGEKSGVMNTGHIAKLKTKGGSHELYIGNFAPNEEISIKFDIWENDRGDSYTFDTNGSWYEDDDDEHKDFEKKVKLTDRTSQMRHEIKREQGDYKGLASFILIQK